MPNPSRSSRLATLGVAAALGCGGGGNSPSDAGATDGRSDPRLVAMEETVTQNPLCVRLGDLYWSVGDATGQIGAGQVGVAHTATSRMPIFSASKLLFSAYVVEREQGVLGPALVRGLNFTSGYAEDGLPLCLPTDTVGSCFEGQLDSYNAARDGTFHYASGHMQKIAALDLGLFGLDRRGFADEIMSVIGTDLALEFSVELTIGGTPVTAGPLAAGGMNTTPEAYERFLTKVVAGGLRIRAHLGTESVTTGQANVDYSLGHWVEKNANATIDAYSSVGALGFYPWIDTTRQTWGILARVETNQSRVGSAATDSLACGAKLRHAFLTSQPQL